MSEALSIRILYWRCYTEVCACNLYWTPVYRFSCMSFPRRKKYFPTKTWRVTLMCQWVFFVSGNMGSLPRRATVHETCHFPDKTFGFYFGNCIFGVSAICSCVWTYRLQWSLCVFWVSGCGSGSCRVFVSVGLCSCVWTYWLQWPLRVVSVNGCGSAKGLTRARRGGQELGWIEKSWKRSTRARRDWQEPEGVDEGKRGFTRARRDWQEPEGIDKVRKGLTRAKRGWQELKGIDKSKKELTRARRDWQELEGIDES